MQQSNSFGFNNRQTGFGLSQEFNSYSNNMNEQQSQGGFMNSQSNFIDNKANRPTRALLPATIKQLLLAEHSQIQESRFKVDDKEFTQIKIVGQIMSVTNQATTTSFILDDGTGSIAAKTFLSNDDDVSGRKQAELEEYTYARVYGKLVEYQGKRSISCHSIDPITDYNEITRHRLEVIHAHLVNKRGMLSTSGSSQPAMGMGSSQQMGFQAQSRPVSGSGFGLSQASVAPVVYDHGLQLTPVQNMVYTVFASSKDNARGITIADVCAALPQVTKSQVADAVEFLTNEGHVFSTIDDDHFSLCM